MALSISSDGTIKAFCTKRILLNQFWNTLNTLFTGIDIRRYCSQTMENEFFYEKFLQCTPDAQAYKYVHLYIQWWHHWTYTQVHLQQPCTSFHQYPFIWSRLHHQRFFDLTLECTASYEKMLTATVQRAGFLATLYHSLKRAHDF